MDSEGCKLTSELLRALVMSLQCIPKANALAQLLWSPSFWFYLCFPGYLPGWVSLNRPSPGESQIIETDECCPSNDVSLLSSVRFSHQLCPTLWDPMNHSTPGLPVHHQLPEVTQLMSIESVMPSNHLILCCPLLLLPSIFPSIRVFSSELALRIRRGFSKDTKG